MKLINKKDIYNIINNYKLDKDKLIIISGAAMVIHGLKESTRDIDLSVTKDYYEYLINNYDCMLEKINEFGHAVYYIGNYINFGVDYFPDDYINIGGLNVQSLESIKKLKEYLNREKDKYDLQLINKRLLRRNNGKV